MALLPADTATGIAGRAPDAVALGLRHPQHVCSVRLVRHVMHTQRDRLLEARLRGHRQEGCGRRTGQTPALSIGTASGSTVFQNIERRGFYYETTAVLCWSYRDPYWFCIRFIHAYTVVSVRMYYMCIADYMVSVYTTVYCMCIAALLLRSAGQRLHATRDRHMTRGIR